jgi:quercetin dioxygenase-like cupin family protein
MGKITIKSFGHPDEKRPFAKGFLEVLNVGQGVIGRGVFEPGWRWSTHVKPIAGTRSCQSSHFGYVISGRMHVVSDEGQEAEMGPGDLVSIGPGHDAWTVGDEACVMVDFSGFAEYAKPHAAKPEQEQAPTP